MTEYVQLPESFLGDAPKAKAWLERALHWAMTLPAKGSKKRGATSGRASRTTVRRQR